MNTVIAHKLFSLSIQYHHTSKHHNSTISVQVCRQLDGLSHFHFTPRPVVLESRVFGAGPENALPSLSLEDIIPTTENSGGLLAPEEVPACLLYICLYSHVVV